MEPSHHLRHKHGHGRIYDTSEVDERSYLDRESRVYNDSSIWQSKIERSEVWNSRISDAVVKDSSVRNSDIRGGMVNWSVLELELIVGNVRINDCEIYGKSRIANNAELHKVSFKDLTVKGNARLRDWPDEEIFDGCHGYITRGLWLKPPRVVRLDFDVTITESVVDERGPCAFVACYEFPIHRWLKIGERYGKTRGWNPEQVDQVRQVLLQWLNEPQDSVPCILGSGVSTISAI